MPRGVYDRKSKTTPKSSLGESSQGENTTQETPQDLPAIWVEIQMPDGVVYRVPAKKLSDNLTDHKKLIEDANKKTWFEVSQDAICVDRINVEGDIWQSSPKKVIC